jgi:hypothetical protein
VYLKVVPTGADRRLTRTSFDLAETRNLGCICVAPVTLHTIRSGDGKPGAAPRRAAHPGGAGDPARLAAWPRERASA